MSGAKRHNSVATLPMKAQLLGFIILVRKN